MTAIHAAPLLERARHIATLAAERADKAEAARTPDPDVMDAVTAAGFTNHFAPPPFGDPESTFVELKRAAVVIGAECPATAWCAVLAALMARAAGYLPPEGQQRLWAKGPDTLIAGGVTPRGTATPAEGGWSLSGVWPSVTAAECADWMLLAARVEGAEADTVAGGRVFTVPCDAVRIDRTWDDVGMRATGSHTVVVDRAFVAAPMTFPLSCFAELDDPQPGPDGRAVPLLAVNTFMFSLAMLGAAHGAVRRWEQLVGARIRERPAGYDPVISHYAEVFARSSSEIDAADLLLDRVGEFLDRAAIVTRADVARNQRDCAFAAELLVGAVDRLMRASGSGGHSTGSALQRLWRDLHTAGAHAALRFGPAAAGYAREVLKGDAHG
ncbi:hydrolase (plasmid) [Streptomyces decoyicus]|uniref:hydrolase n=1 Tax=Streptomyces decoyicus TaxID=249567 RepID=UPI002E34BB1B|nr:hydrolase [Streptomyces decoyicus]